MFETLAAGDILFIDSSHIAMPGTDVDRLFLDVLPRLASGTLVHIHDITLPDAYPESGTGAAITSSFSSGRFCRAGGYELVFRAISWREHHAKALANGILSRIPLVPGAH